ncbi:MAG TPA: cupredoxin domain-containing protein [Coriobacteriia bacterium]|nr:cupredoxin domain-containing protein [Coriobacteriia bacterium]
MAHARKDSARDMARELAHAEGRRRSLVRAAVLVALAAAVIAIGAVAFGLTDRAETAQTPVGAQPEADAETAPKLEVQPEPRLEPMRAPAKAAPASKPVLQKLSINIGTAGYEPAVIEARADAPIELTVAQGEGCAAGFLMPDLGLSADNTAGPATLALGKLEKGTYRFACGMDMVEGHLVVQ